MTGRWAPDADTVLCISLSARPSSFGMTVHNAGYRALGLNYLYKALTTRDLSGALHGVRALGIRGCSLSMPFKEQALVLLDRVDPAAAMIGAVNTVVNQDGALVGYNTDAHGATVVLRSLRLPKSTRVLVLGAGGVARAILYALETLRFGDITVTSRSAARATRLARSGHVVVPWEQRHEVDAELIINATPIGMRPDARSMPIDPASVHRAKAVMDVVVIPHETRFVRTARAARKKVVVGPEMSLHQALRQFQLYTGKTAPIHVMRRAMKRYLA